MSLTFLGVMAQCLLTAAPADGSYLCQPAFARDWEIRGPIEPYTPQPGDIFLATDQRLWFRWGHLIAGANGLHHSGLVIALPDGQLGLIEAGPFNKLHVKIMNPYRHMHEHFAAGDRVWVRRRRTPLTAEQSARLTAFALAQDGKPFDTLRWLGQLTPLRARGPLKTWFVGGPSGGRRAWFCSELVTECCVSAGIMNRATARPSSTYPSDLFWGRSYNLYLNRHLDDLTAGWCPPARWLPMAPPSVHPSPQSVH